MNNPFDDLPGSDLLRQALNFGQAPQPQPAPADNTRTAKAGGSKGAGGGSAPGGGAKTKTASSSRDQAWDDSPAEIGEHNPEPVADPVEVKAKATLKKLGWVQEKTLFKSEAEIFAEFTVPASEKHRTLVEFQLLIREKGDFKIIETAKGHADANGRATAKVPIRKPADAEKATFALKTKHCTADWSKETGTEREVTETAEQDFKHTQVSGIHFTKNKSFIAPQYLKVFRDLESEFKSWRAQHETAKIVVYGHAERDEEDPRKLSARRSQAAFAFLIGDYHTWNRIANEERWGLWEQQHMLQALGHYKGKVDGIYGPATKAAIKEFITWLNENECKNLNPLLGLTEEYIRLELYRVYITGPKRTVILPSAHFRLVSGNPFVGCGAFNRYKGGKESYPENRRATFLLIAESYSFPVTFPCRSGSGPCESETQKPGERAVTGFGCKFYDDLMRKEKAGEGVESLLPLGDEAPWMVFALAEARRWKGADEKVITKSINYHKEVGVALPDLNGTTHAWCASFVNYCLKQAGFPVSKQTARARSFKSDENFKALTEPQYGAIACIADHHVCFVVAKDKDGIHTVTLGGNTSNTIKYNVFRESTTFYFPKSYEQKSPTPLETKSAAELNATIGISKSSNAQVTTR